MDFFFFFFFAVKPGSLAELRLIDLIPMVLLIGINS